MTAIELGSITPGDLGIKTGDVGISFTMTDAEGPEQWEVRFTPSSDWLQYRGFDGWETCTSLGSRIAAPNGAASQSSDGMLCDTLCGRSSCMTTSL